MTWIGLDWDYVTGDCTAECNDHCSRTRCPYRRAYGARQAHIWRGGAVPTEGWDKRLAQVERMLRRVTLTGQVVFRDSHADIVDFLVPGDHVLHIDDHLDSYPDSRLYCGSWREYADVTGVTSVHVRPPAVKRGEYSLFVCLSRPYTSPALDGALLRVLCDIRHPIDFLGWGSSKGVEATDGG